MARPAQQLEARALLDDLARIHDGHAVRHLVDHAEVVGDEQHRRARLGGQIAQQLQDLRADGGVERRGRLVGDQELRPHRHGHGDHHALLESAGELVRIGGEATLRVGNADERKELEDARSRLIAGHGRVQLDRLHHLVADGCHRIEAGHRLLEDHADPGAAHGAHLGDRQGQEIAALELDAAAGLDAAGLGHQPHDGERGHRLAAPGFADQRQRLARRNREADAVDDTNVSAPIGK
jgi:hypothetical protein